MAIRELTPREFDAFGPTRMVVAELIVEEVEWYADLDDLVLGLIARHGVVPGWFIAVFGRDQRGTFRAFDADASFDSDDNARRGLFLKMERALATGARVFPQRD